MQEINLYRLVRFYVKNWLIIVSLTILGLIGGLVYNNLIQKPLYKSEATLIYINLSQQSSTQDVTLLNNYVELFKSRRVLQPVINDQKLNLTYDQFVGSVSATNDKGTEVISLSVSTNNPDVSRNFLNEAVNSFKKQAKNLYGSDDLSIVDNASDESLPYNVHKATQLSIAGAVGFIISLIVVFFIYDIKGDAPKVKKSVKKPIATKTKQKVKTKSARAKETSFIRFKRVVTKPSATKVIKPTTKKTSAKRTPAKKSSTTKKTTN